MIDTFITLEGPITDKIQISGGLRRSLLDLIFPAVAPDDIGIRQAPVYLDYQFKLELLAHQTRPSAHLGVRVERPPRADSERGGGRRSCHPRTNRARDELLQQPDRLEPQARRQGRAGVWPSTSVRRRSTSGSATSSGSKGTFIKPTARGEWRYQITDRVQLITGLDVYVAPVDLTYVGPQPEAQEGAGSGQGSLAGEETVFAESTPRSFGPGSTSSRTRASARSSSSSSASVSTTSARSPRLPSTPASPPSSACATTCASRSARASSASRLSSKSRTRRSAIPNSSPLKAVHLGARLGVRRSSAARFGVEGFYKYLWDRPVPTPGGIAPFYVERRNRPHLRR